MIYIFFLLKNNNRKSGATAALMEGRWPRRARVAGSAARPGPRTRVRPGAEARASAGRRGQSLGPREGGGRREPGGFLVLFFLHLVPEEAQTTPYVPVLDLLLRAQNVQHFQGQVCAAATLHSVPCQKPSFHRKYVVISLCYAGMKVLNNIIYSNT